MKTRVAISLAVLSFAAGATSQEYSEPSNFSITEALLENGVNVSAIPQLQELENEERSFSDPCAIAVYYYIHTWVSFVDSSSVQLAQAFIWKSVAVERRRLRCFYNRILVNTGCICRSVVYLQTYEGPGRINSCAFISPHAMPVCYQRRRPYSFPGSVFHPGRHHSVA
jgi:hypothetical protein